MRDLFKRLLGGKAEKTGDSRQAFAELNREAPLLPAQPGSSASSEAEGFVCRETLLGRDQRVSGYHFLLQQATRYDEQAGAGQADHQPGQVSFLADGDRLRGGCVAIDQKRPRALGRVKELPQNR